MLFKLHRHQGADTARLVKTEYNKLNENENFRRNFKRAYAAANECSLC